jgi:hypothetical protein
MKSKKAVSAASYPSRIFEDYQALNESGHLLVCPKLNINVATRSKNKETTTQSWSEDFSSGHFFMF